ncbi:ATP-binding protein [Geomicrobium sediminis]|uniref:AAA+ superfamily predicted ATPase n=1 Tax=Geomicrobium sediminis TaxID=1347788 RepID=A0ABS2PAA4_9BACL|nr:ATP-binding protein [Geomicrobium sediminis]MBM7632071.1 AAA+ superfamily predicted ATPase [Geomicrobium sediminis]
MKTIYPYVNEHNTEVSGYAPLAKLLSTITRTLEETFGTSYSAFQVDEHIFDLWTIFEEDVKSESDELTHVAQIFEHLGEYTFEYEEGAQIPKYRVHRAYANQVFAYHHDDVAFAQIPIFSEASVFYMHAVFASNQEAMSAFLTTVRERMWNKSKNEILLLKDSDEGLSQEYQAISKDVTRDEVILEDFIKREIYRSLDQFFQADRSFFETYNVPYKRGILLYGPPGNGKTTLVKSIANSVDAPVAYWQITEFTSSDSIQEVFETAQKLAPMILVIEDIDSLPDHTRSYFLNTLDGATSKEGIFLIGTTNYPEKIDPGLVNRAGRFDRGYEITAPPTALRKQYIQQLGFPMLDKSIDVDHITLLTDGFSFAQIKELFMSSAIEWHNEGTLNITQTIDTIKKEKRKSERGEWWDDSERTLGF